MAKKKFSKQNRSIMISNQMIFKKIFAFHFKILEIKIHFLFTKKDDVSKMEKTNFTKKNL